MSLDAFEGDLAANLEALRQDLASGRYRPQPVRRVLVPKVSGGLRPLAIWTVRDRIAQRVVHDALEPVLDALFLDCSFGYRPNRSVTDAVTRVLACRDGGLRWVLHADIQDCFDSMDSRILLRLLRPLVPHRPVLVLVERWLSAGIWNPASDRPEAAGTCQGSVLSPLLSNLYLHPFDRSMVARGLRLVRYADDFCIFCRRKREALQALAAAQQALRPLQLQLNQDKTRVVHFDQGFRYLGVLFVRGRHRRL